MTPASSRWAISSGQRTEPGSQTRARSLRSRSTIITCSAPSFSPSTSTPAGRVPLIGIVTSRSPRRARKSSGEADTIVQPWPANGRGASGRRWRSASASADGIAGERRREVLHEVRLVDVAARDRGAHRLDRRGVALVVPAALPLPDLVADGRDALAVLGGPDPAGEERQRARLGRRGRRRRGGSRPRARSRGRGRRRARRGPRSPRDSPRAPRRRRPVRAARARTPSVARASGGCRA